MTQPCEQCPAVAERLTAFREHAASRMVTLARQRVLLGSGSLRSSSHQSLRYQGGAAARIVGAAIYDLLP